MEQSRAPTVWRRLNCGPLITLVTDNRAIVAQSTRAKKRPYLTGKDAVSDCAFSMVVAVSTLLFRAL